MPVPRISVLNHSAIGPFSWRWPTNEEKFERGWFAAAEIDGEEVAIRHGIGHRVVFGRDRTHSVTWVDGEPTVEGVEADDFSRSESLLSLIKVTKRHLRPGDHVPSAYGALPVVVMADEARGPYSPRSLAVKLRQDDVTGWTRHALLRAAAWGRLSKKRRMRTALPPITTQGPVPAAPTGDTPQAVQHAVAAALLKYGASLKPSEAGPAVEFTPNAAANDFLRRDAFGFLTAVLMDQGIPAERAWEAPYLLRERLGHLDPHKFASGEEKLRAAVQRPPMLHRYIEKMPHWLALAGKRVVKDYAGDAAAIWSDRPTADMVQRRFDAFTGIGQKKAAMAVEILARDLGVKITGLDKSDVAYDIHLRRVFLRTRLADRDDQAHMIEVARRLHPTRPGALDLPAWNIGRTWCHPGVPNCETCPLTEVCPKDIEGAAQVTSG